MMPELKYKVLKSNDWSEEGLNIRQLMYFSGIRAIADTRKVTAVSILRKTGEEETAIGAYMAGMKLAKEFTLLRSPIVVYAFEAMEPYITMFTAVTGQVPYVAEVHKESGGAARAVVVAMLKNST